MSLLFMDGMDYLAAGDAALDEKWNTAKDDTGTSSLNWGASTGRFGDGGTSIGAGTGSSFLEKVIPAKTTLIVGFAFKMNATAEGKCLSFGYAGDEQIAMFIESDLTISFFKHNQNTISDTPIASTITSGDALNEGVWFHIEVKIVVDPTNGSIEMRVNEVEWINKTGIDTDPRGQGSYNDVTFVDGAGGNSGYAIDDVYIMDDAGSRLNDFIGDVRIETIQPSADTAQADFTPKSGGDNYVEVDDDTRDEDGSYNESDTVGHKDMFVMEDLSETPKEIFAIQASINARKTEAGTRGLKAVVDVGGTDYDGAEHLLNQDYLYEMTIWELSPDTGAPWTESEINNMDAGYEVSS